jgi:predicted permease
VQGLLGDFIAALRGFARSRSVTLLAVLCLALGLGVSTAMLGLLDLLLFRPPEHVLRAKSLKRLMLSEVFPGVGELTSTITSYPVFQDLRSVGAFSGLEAFYTTDLPLGRGVEARLARTVLATPGFFELLGVRPTLGRSFSAGEAQPGRSASVALLSDGLWRRGYGADRHVLGRQLAMGNDLYTIIGVLPPGFTGVDLDRIEVWLPINAAERVNSPNWAECRGCKFLEIVSRLKLGISRELAQDEATAVYRQGAAHAGQPQPKGRVSLFPIQRARGPDAPVSVRVVAWLTGLAWIVLLISCGNAAALLLVRAWERQREFALRLALGARRLRLVCMVLMEGAVLALAGGLAGLFLCLLFGRFLERVIVPEAELPSPALAPRTLLVLTALTATAALVSGLLPGLWVGRSSLAGAIRSGSRESGPERSRLHLALAAGQVALAVGLLAVAAELAMSLFNVLHLDLGLDASRVLVASVDLGSATLAADRNEARWLRVLELVRSLPPVQHASLAATIPFATSVAGSLSVPGLEPLPELSTGGPYLNAVTPDFWKTTGTPLLRGREFGGQDAASAARVAIVNQTMARLFWPGRDALGQCLRVGGERAPCATVVGIVRDARRVGLQEDPTLQSYVPLAQAPTSLSSRALLARTRGEPRSLIRSVRQQIQTFMPAAAFVDVRPLDELLAPQIRPWRMGAAALAPFALLALGLAMVGLYGVVAHATARRTYELAVRVALGAQHRAIRWLVVRQGLTIAGTGVSVGLGLTLLASRFLQPMLFQVSARDPWLLGAAAGIELLVALAASAAPSRRLQRLHAADLLRLD